MGLSSNTVIHFTKSLSFLKGILSDNFKVRYCRETIETSAKKIDILVPIVSFCDIPFSQVLNHIDSYGCYGLGLKKKWAEQKGLNPVLYLEKHSTLSFNIANDLLKRLATEDGKKIYELSTSEKNTKDVIRYLKNYQGDLRRTGKKDIPNYRFSDEREWRYVLSTSEESSIYANLKSVKDDNEVKNAKQKYNDKIIDKRLTFTPEDINYIIINKEAERDGIIRFLGDVKGKFPHHEVERLKSRIISVEQLRTDF